MNNDVKKILYNRAKLIQNLDKIVSSSKRNNKGDGQLSLFASSDDHVDIEISLDEPENFDPLKMAKFENDALGFSIVYSQFDEYFAVKCRYCNSTIATVLNDEENDDQDPKTLLAEIRSIEYKVSQYGNKYAKIVFKDDTAEDRLYLFGKLYERMIHKCFIGEIYLLTVKKAESDPTKIDIVNFMLAREIPDVCKTSKTLYVSTSVMHLPELRVYLRAHMMGTNQSVSITVSDFDTVVTPSWKVSVDNENLLEMNKKGFKIKLL